MTITKLIMVLLIYFSLIGLTQSALLIVGSHGANYAAIQEAVDAASSGDVIEVQEGTYSENIVLNKALILRGIGHPIIDSKGNHSIITLSSNGIVVEGFIIINANDSGIKTNYNDNILIKDNIIRDNKGGIEVKNSDNASVIGNTIINNTNIGIYVQSSMLSLIDNNSIYNTVAGITLKSSNKNFIKNNIINNTQYGISLGYLTLSEAGRGGFSDANLLEGNLIENSKYGIHLDYSKGNNISSNKLTRNNYAIYAVSSENNTIRNNKYANNIQNESIDSRSRDDNTLNPYAFLLVFGVAFILANFILGIVAGIISGLIIKKMLKYSSIGLIGDAIIGIIGSILGFYGSLFYISFDPVIAGIVAAITTFILVLLAEILRRSGKSKAT